MKPACRRNPISWLSAVTALILMALHAGQAAASAAPAPPANHAKGVSLIDVTSGRILFSQRGDEPMRVASLTKIMTAIVAIEHGGLDDMVTVSARAAGKEGSSIYLKAGEKMTLRNLLYGLMLRSGNDAAVAIAEHVGGSLDGFVYLMNRKAEELGLSRSSFANPHGLDEPNHYMSANDLARLTAYCLRNPTFSAIVKTRVKTAPNPLESWDYKWVNKNKMLTLYEGADGVKTGYTKQALRTLVSSATRNGQQLAVVTLNDGDDWTDHRNLLDFGFKHFPLAEVAEKSQPVAGYPYAVAETFRYPFTEGEKERVRVRLAPLKPGTPHYLLGYRGQLHFELDGTVIGSVPLKDFRDARTLDQTASARATAKASFGDFIHMSLRALLFLGSGPTSADR